MLAVQVDYTTQRASIGIERGRPVPRREILDALRGIGYSGAFQDEAAPSSRFGPFTQDELLARFDSDRNGRFDPSETRLVRSAFGDIDVPMLPGEPLDYETPTIPVAAIRSALAEADNLPADNPTTNHGATLGRVLFYDKNLSRNRTIACASCHPQQNAFADPRRYSVGYEAIETRRNSMGLCNARYSNVNGHRPGFFWDERADTLEAQALIPIQDPIEMGMTLAELEQRLSALPYYPALFTAAFGTAEVTSERVARALAQFVRSLVSFDSRFDRALTAAPDESAEFDGFSEDENLGKSLFLSGRDGVAEHGCAHCHVPPTFAMPRAMNNGLALHYEDAGLGALGRTPNDPFDPSNDGKFKAPSLRNVALTAPYMHDGRLASLESVIDHYSDGIQPHENLSLSFDDESGAPAGLGLRFTPRQKAAIVAFLKTLTDETFISDPRYSDPFVRSDPIAEPSSSAR